MTIEEWLIAVMLTFPLPYIVIKKEKTISLLCAITDDIGLAHVVWNYHMDLPGFTLFSLNQNGYLFQGEGETPKAAFDARIIVNKTNQELLGDF